MALCYLNKDKDSLIRLCAMTVVCAHCHVYLNEKMKAGTNLTVAIYIISFLTARAIENNESSMGGGNYDVNVCVPSLRIGGTEVGRVAMPSNVRPGSPSLLLLSELNSV